MRQGGVARDDRENQYRQTQAGGEGNRSWHPASHRAVSLLGSVNIQTASRLVHPKKSLLHFQTVAENSWYPEKNCRKDGELDYLLYARHFANISCSWPHLILMTTL